MRNEVCCSLNCLKKTNNREKETIYNMILYDMIYSVLQQEYTRRKGQQGRCQYSVERSIISSESHEIEKTKQIGDWLGNDRVKTA